MQPEGPWQHPWLRVELATRAVLAERMAKGQTPPRDQALLTLIELRKHIERAGHFN